MSAPHHATAGHVTSTVALRNGVAMPWLGLGVWQAGDDRATEQAVRTAIEHGYRSIDTAKIYGNERGVGRALRDCGVPREQLFITTKVWNEDVRAGRVAAAFERSRQLLGLDYVDLYLVHWPIAGKVVSTWHAMEQLAQAGRVRAIGVSNHLVLHLQELLAAAEIKPAVNQIEFHPYLQSRALVEFCGVNGIQVEAWSPLGQGGALLAEPALVEIARRLGRTPAQVVLRWDLQRGVVTIPKSSRPERIAENAGLFDFALTPDDMAAIDALECGRRLGPDPAQVAF